MILSTRKRALILFITFPWLLAAGCGGSGDTDDNNGGSGAGGRSTGGRGGEDASGGKASKSGGSGNLGGDGSGGSAVGGRSSGGSSSGGRSTGGDGGGDASGGVTSTGGRNGVGGMLMEACGNEELDELEQCDDPDDENCSESCTYVGCDECRSAVSDPTSNYADCDAAPFTADEKAKCAAVLACIRATDCARGEGDLQDVRACYCGEVAPTQCFLGGPQEGPCKDEITEAAGPDLQPFQIGALFLNFENPAGLALSTARHEFERCNAECYEGEPYDPGAGTGGTGSGGGESGGAPSVGGSSGGATAGGAPSVGGAAAGGEASVGGAAAGGAGAGGAGAGGSGGTSGQTACEACSDTWCSYAVNQREARCAGDACTSYEACVAESGCAASDVRDCYCGVTPYTTCFLFDAAAPLGACKDITNTMAGSTTPLQVGTLFFDGAYPLGASNNLLVCQATSCAAECFPQ